MTTQIIEANQGILTNEMQTIKDYEMLDENIIKDSIAKGASVILKNNQRNYTNPVGIGDGFLSKVCTSIDISAQTEELIDMLKIIKLSGSDIVIENSFSSDMNEKREKLLKICSVPYGTRPIIQSVFENYEKYKNISKLSKKKILSDIEKQVTSGVDYIVVNPALTFDVLDKIKDIDIFTSLSAKFTAMWMKATGKENPFAENFEEILDILRTYDATLVIETCINPSSIFDGVGIYELKELSVVAELVKLARISGVQVMVNVSFHRKIDKIKNIIDMIKDVTDKTPIMVSDIDIIDSCEIQSDSSCIVSQALALFYGANVIQTKQMPKTTSYFNAKLLKESIDSAKLACYSADVSKNNKKATEKEFEFRKTKTNSFDESLFLKEIFS